VDGQCRLGEGAIWDTKKQVLWWIDILPGILHCYDPASDSDREWEIGQMIGTVVSKASGGLMVALENGFASFDPVSNRLNIVSDPESDIPTNRFNDGKCDPAGRFWAGTMAISEVAGAGALYCLDGAGECSKHVENISVSNGIVWTADQKTMYYIDSPTRQIDAFDYDIETGLISNRRTAVEMPQGVGNPDGMTIDAEDNLWVAMWGGWCVLHVNPRTQKVLDKVDVAASNVTSCAFGGADLQDLYITSARNNLEKSGVPDQPQAGGLFRARTDVKGVVAFEYAG